MQLNIAPGYTTPNFQGSKKENKEYKDPLMRWPIRGLAYTNELGAAISEVAPKMGTLLWFPAMLYFGADIYDKYKNEKTNYSPSATRGTQQAIFQALASVIMPTGSILIGQKATSLLGKFGKTGLSYQTQEEITRFLNSYISRRNLSEHAGDVEEFKKTFNNTLEIYNKKKKTELSTFNPFTLIRNFIFNKRHPGAVAYSPGEKVLAFANTKIDEAFSIYHQLNEDDFKKPKEFSNKMYKDYLKLKSKFQADPSYKGTAKSDAIDLIIKKYNRSGVQQAKVLKTIGGFIALGLAIKPIDEFVEHVVMQKFVKPRMEQFQQSRVDEFRSKMKA